MLESQDFKVARSDVAACDKAIVLHHDIHPVPWTQLDPDLWSCVLSHCHSKQPGFIVSQHRSLALVQQSWNGINSIVQENRGHGYLAHVSVQSNAFQDSLQRAIDSAPNHGVVAVQAGVYNERIRISKPIRLQGAVGGEAVVLTAGLDFMCNRVDGGVIVAGVTNLADRAEALTAECGNLHLIDCSVQNGGVYVRGRSSSAVLERCEIQICSQNGVLAEKGGTIDMQQCQIRRCEWSVNGRAGGQGALIGQCSLVDPHSAGAFTQAKSLAATMYQAVVLRGW